MGDWKPDRSDVIDGKSVYLWTVRGEETGTASGAAR
jgi:hypothetical protein